jgi:hypothetical protein
MKRDFEEWVAGVEGDDFQPQMDGMNTDEERILR